MEYTTRYTKHLQTHYSTFLASILNHPFHQNSMSDINQAVLRAGIYSSISPITITSTTVSIRLKSTPSDFIVREIDTNQNCVCINDLPSLPLYTPPPPPPPTDRIASNKRSAPLSISSTPLEKKPRLSTTTPTLANLLVAIGNNPTTLQSIAALQLAANESLTTDNVAIPPVVIPSVLCQDKDTRRLIHETIPLIYPLLTTTVQSGDSKAILISINTQFTSLTNVLSNSDLSKLTIYCNINISSVSTSTSSQSTHKCMLLSTSKCTRDERRDIHRQLHDLTGKNYLTGTTDGIIFVQKKGHSNRGRGGRNSNNNNNNQNNNKKHKKSSTLFSAVLKKNRVDQNETAARFKRINVVYNLNFAGTKDKQAVTYQNITFHSRPSFDIHNNEEGNTFVTNINQKFQQLHRSGSIEISNVQLCHKPIQLGQLWGNRFEIVVRCHFNTKEKDDLEKDQKNEKKIFDQSTLLEQLQHNASTISNHGFINYYGLQRLGNSNISSWQIGQALLLQQYDTAVRLILSVRQKESDDIVKAKMSLMTSVQDCLKLMPHRMVLEKLLLNGLKRYGWEVHLLHNSKDNSAHSAGSNSQSNKDSNDNSDSNGNGDSDRNSSSSSSFNLKNENFQKANDLAKRSIETLPVRPISMWVRSYQSYVWNIMASERIQLAATATLNDAEPSNAVHFLNGDYYIEKEEKNKKLNLNLAKQCEMIEMFQEEEEDTKTSSSSVTNRVIVMPALGSVTNPYIRQSPLLMRLVQVAAHKLQLTVDVLMHTFDNVNLEKCYRTPGTLRTLICVPRNIVTPVMESGEGKGMKIGFDLQSGSYATCCLRELLGTNDVM